MKAHAPAFSRFGKESSRSVNNTSRPAWRAWIHGLQRSHGRAPVWDRRMSAYRRPGTHFGVSLAPWAPVLSIQQNPDAPGFTAPEMTTLALGGAWAASLSSRACARPTPELSLIHI